MASRRLAVAVWLVGLLSLSVYIHNTAAESQVRVQYAQEAAEAAIAHSDSGQRGFSRTCRFLVWRIAAYCSSSTRLPPRQQCG